MPYSASQQLQPVADKPKKKASRVWFDVHSWVGLKLSIFMSFILVTGTLAVFAHEIDWLLNTKMHSGPRTEQTKSLGWMLDKVEEAYPEWTIFSIAEPIDPWFTSEAVALNPDGDRRRIWIDQYSGVINGDGPWVNVHRFLRQSHRHLMLPVYIGVPIVSALSFLLIASLVSGLVVYKKFWRGFFKAPRTQSARIFWGDLHRLFGLWSLWFILIIALTGVWYLVEQSGGRAPGHPGAGERQSSQETALSNVQLEATAQAAYPSLEILAIRPPSRPNAPIVFLGQAEASLVRDRANFVSLDPSTGEILTVADARYLSVHQRISEMADPLHFGTLAGFPTKIIWFLFGCVLSALSISGMYIYTKRLVRRYADTSKKSILWYGMGRWRHINVILIAICLGLTPFALSLL